MNVVDVRPHELRATLRSATVHEHDVDGDPMKPSRELRLTTEVFQAAMNLEEDFLDDVLELGARADHSKDEARHLRAVSKEELSESLAIPPLAARDHFVWFEHSIEANSRSGRMPEQNTRDRDVHLSFWCDARRRHSKA